jgi:hypothetical protein
VDDKFRSILERNAHAVIHGSSKQGKTSLRKIVLSEVPHILVQCSNKWLLQDLHGAILKQAGCVLSQSTSKTVSGANKVLAKIGTAIPKVAKIELSRESESGSELEEQFKPVEIDIQDVNDVISLLDSAGCPECIVLEDFHYLPVETQADFAVSLKALHENSPYKIIVVGVWLEDNRLTVFNGDLAWRVMSVDADSWSVDQLGSVIEAGAELLNVRFAKKFTDNLLKGCYGNVAIVQQVCYLCCEAEGVADTLPERRRIGENVDVEKLIGTVVSQSAARFRAFLRSFSGGFQSTELGMYKWLVGAVLKAEDVSRKRGLSLKEINAFVNTYHPGKPVNPGNVTQALQSSVKLQIEKNVKPIILDYDQTDRRLCVVDKSFLIWLAYQNVDGELGEIGLELDASNGEEA